MAQATRKNITKSVAELVAELIAADAALNAETNDETSAPLAERSGELERLILATPVVTVADAIALCRYMASEHKVERVREGVLDAGHVHENRLLFHTMSGAADVLAMRDDETFRGAAKRHLSALFGDVQETGDWERDNQAGNALAVKLIKQMAGDGFTPMFGHIVRGMIDKGRYGGIEVGFFQAFSEAAVCYYQTGAPPAPVEDEAALDDAFVAATEAGDDAADHPNADLAGMTVLQLCREWEIVQAKAAYDYAVSDHTDRDSDAIYSPAADRQQAIVEEVGTRSGGGFHPTLADVYAVVSLLQNVMREEAVMDDEDRALVSVLLWWLGDMTGKAKLAAAA